MTNRYDWKTLGDEVGSVIDLLDFNAKKLARKKEKQKIKIIKS